MRCHLRSVNGQRKWTLGVKRLCAGASGRSRDGMNSALKRSARLRQTMPSFRCRSPSIGSRMCSSIAQRVTAVSSRRRPSPIRALMPLAAQPGMISLGSGSPSPESFPVTNISITLRDGSSVTLGETATAAAMQYSPTTGMPPLTKWISQLQAAEHGWQVGAGGRICVTTGSQNALHLALTMLLESGDTVLADEYAYPGMLETVRPMGVDVLGVAGDGLGMDPDSLEAVLQQHASGAARRPRPRVLYTIPTGHNPTGATLPNPRRRRVYELCQQYDILILEDDAYWFLSLDEPMSDVEPLESFLSMDARSGDGRVLRFDSLSKVLSAGLRVGWVSGPSALIERIELHQQVAALHSSGLSQAVVAAVLEAWGPAGWHAHCKGVRALYRARRGSMHASAVRHLDGLASWTRPTHGMFFWLDLTPSGCTDTNALVKTRAVEAKVLLIPGSSFAAAAAPLSTSPFVRAAFSLASEEEMDVGMERLAGLLKSM